MPAPKLRGQERGSPHYTLPPLTATCSQAGTFAQFCLDFKGGSGRQMSARAEQLLGWGSLEWASLTLAEAGSSTSRRAESHVWKQRCCVPLV